MMYMFSTLLPTQRPCFCLGGVLLTFFIGISTLGGYADVRIWYVDVDSPAASPDGSSWETAFTNIQHAVDAAVEQGASEIEPAEVWVTKGVYSGIGGKSSKFGEHVLFMHPYVHLYGGFSGNETARAQRNWELNKTVIDGEDKRRCVLGAAHSILDGFTVTHGATKQNGGGLYTETAHASVVNCIFLENKANDWGGGLRNGIATNCIFKRNVAKGKGGGLCNGVATNCIFIDNMAQLDGGGMCFGDAINSIFTGNSTQRNGGGMLKGSAKNCRFKSNSAKQNGGGLCTGVATNCVFIGNTAHKNGGGMCWSGAVNSTFFGNRAQGSGGGVYDRYSVFLTNCIVWGNSAEKEGQAIYPVHAEVPRVTCSCIEGGYTGEGNIDTPPLFVNPGEGDVSLLADSPCIDAGTSKDAPATDIQGTSRPQGNGVDIGAYEWSGESSK